MTRGLGTRIALTGLLVAVLLVCGSCVYVHMGNAGMPRHERQVELSAPLTAGASFSAETGDGSITVHGVETAECKVLAKIVAHARTEERARELAEQIEPKLEPSGAGLKVVINRPPVAGRAWYAVSLEVQVPQQTNLGLVTGDGSVNVTDITASIDARTSDGSIKTEAIRGNMKLQTSDGSISCARLDGTTLDLHTNDGGITLTSVRAETITARTGDGSIRGKDIAAGRAEYHTGDGSIHIDCAQDAPKAPDVTATTSDGAIAFTTPPGLSAVIEASTGDGSIHTSLPLSVAGKIGKSLTGTVGDGKGRIRLRTHDGSITIR